MVQLGILKGQIGADLHDLALKVQRVGGEQPGVGAVLVGLALVQGYDRIDPVGVEADIGRPVGHVGHDFHPHPQSGGPAHGDGVAAQLQHIGRIAGVEHRYVQVGQHPCRGGRQGGRLGVGVVAGQHHHPAIRVGAGEHGMADGVGGPVDAGGFAVPDPDDAVVAGIGSGGGQLAAHYRSGRILLVHRRPQHNVGLPRFPNGSLQGRVEPAHRRTGIARRERRGVQPRRPVGSQLLQREPGHGLNAGEEDRSGIVGEAIGEPVTAVRLGGRHVEVSLGASSGNGAVQSDQLGGVGERERH